MKNLLESGATRTSSTILAIGANFDPEVLQWPGGSVVAMLLCIYATIAVVFGGHSKGLAYGVLSGSVGKGTAL